MRFSRSGTALFGPFDRRLFPLRESPRLGDVTTARREEVVGVIDVLAHRRRSFSGFMFGSMLEIHVYPRPCVSFDFDWEHVVG